jgi:hypothetical protein
MAGHDRQERHLIGHTDDVADQGYPEQCTLVFFRSGSTAPEGDSVPPISE